MKNKKGNFGGIVQLIIILLLILLIIGTLVVIIDLFTIKDIGTEKVRCIDKAGVKFIDEYCDKKIVCSWLGIVGNKYKCKEYNKNETL